MAILAAGVLSLIFIINVMIGAATGVRMLGDVSEMLILLAASICFVAAILRHEAEALENNSE